MGEDLKPVGRLTGILPCGTIVARDVIKGRDVDKPEVNPDLLESLHTVVRGIGLAWQSSSLCT